MKHQFDVCVVSPCEIPDVRLAREALKTGAYAYVHLGRDAQVAQQALDALARHTQSSFGIALAHTPVIVDLPGQVNRILLPWGVDDSIYPTEVLRVWQVSTVDEAAAAMDASALAIAVKGNDAAGKVGDESTFILFQRVIEMARRRDVKVFVHGGVGIHSSAAYLALGAAGVHLDSQVILLPECGAPPELKVVLRKLGGNETMLVNDYRVLRWPTMPRVGPDDEIEDLLGGWNLDINLLPIGQDFTMAGEYLNRYEHLDALVGAICEAAYGHLRQAQHRCALTASSPFARSLGVQYPIIQGPMGRVSDTADFLRDVAAAGALPMLAVGMASPESTAQMLAATSQMLPASPWGVGLLGFVQPAVFDAQAAQVVHCDHKPTAVVIAGGRPSQAKRFEQAGIRAFLHVPSAALLDKYVKEGAHSFIFEGRESGGHVGPLFSTVLWEKQLMHLLDLEDATSLNVVFAGAIHDAWSSAFVSIMAASLAARGANIGVQMGTAYLMTAEAVSSGAITQNFQNLLGEYDRTVLLESAPGQETRALPTAFVDFFQQEKARVEALDIESLDKRLMLEQLNLGRARLASKGLEHQSDARELVDVDLAGQVSRGLYMAGSVAPMLHTPKTMALLHDVVCNQAQELINSLAPVVELDDTSDMGVNGDDANTVSEPIAIIGMAGVFPDANDIDEYWQNILSGRDCVTEVPRSRWDPDIFYRPNTTDTDFVVSKWGAFLSSIAFDPVEFGIPPASVKSIEPAQLLSLLVAKRALGDAGYVDSIRDGLPDTSVIFGTEAMGELSSAYGERPGIRMLFGTLPPEIGKDLPVVDEDSFPGVLSNVTAGRIANRLNCGGRNYTVDAACASSLAALDVACQELWSGRSSMVICGGADLHNSILDYIWFSGTHALSRRGYCATFDESGDGLALGEGVGAVVLKRVSDAERDHDKIYGIIRGIDGSSDGRSLGLTAPNMSGQVRALKRAYKMAKILPSEVGLVEAHGTGTAVGDRTELTALSHVALDAGALPGQTWIGSVKTQIGHTKCAAGVAGLIRATLAVRHGVIPPTLHLDNPVRSYQEGVTPFQFNTNGHAGIWNSERRIAGVSGFGFGGSNFHAIVENYEQTPNAPTAAAWPYELFMARGDTLDDACERLRKVKPLWLANHEIHLRDVAYSLATESEKPVQVCIVAGSWQELLEKIEHVMLKDNIPGVFYRDPVPGKLCFLFSGQGSQHVNMARDLFVMFPWLRTQLAAHPDYAKIVFPQAVFTDQERSQQALAVTDTRNAQPLLGIVDSAIADLLTWFGVTPNAVAGHSYGELPALAYAGAIASNDLVDLSAARAQAIMSCVGDDPGAMAAISLPAQQVEQLVGGRDDVWPVNYNATNQTVIGGTTAGVDAVAAKCRTQKIRCQRLNVACAFHSPLLEGADRAFGSYLQHVAVSAPKLPVWSNTTAQPYPTDGQDIKARLAEHLVRPVRFSDELHAMYDDGVRIFIEAGPGTALIGLAGATLPEDIVTIPTQTSGGDGMRTLLCAMAQIVACGRTIDVDKLFYGRSVSALNLDVPAQYATTPTTWMVNGQAAVPITRWRDQGEQHLVRETLALQPDFQRLAQEEENMSQPPAAPSQPSNNQVPPPVAAPMPLMPSPANQLVLTYLQNIRIMLDDQRDIILATLGFGQGQYPMPMMNAQPTQAVPMAPMPAWDYQPMTAMPTSPVYAQPSWTPAMMPTPTMEAARPMQTEAVGQPEVTQQDPAPADQPAEEPDGPSSVSILPPIADLSKEQLTQIILDVVAEKTGYPTEMMGLDMDLEADLSIDSIKRLEIIGALEEKVSIPEADIDSDEADSVLEKLATIKTLRLMVDYLQSSGDMAASADAAEVVPSPVEQTHSVPASAAVQPSPDDDVPIRRLVWQRSQYPFEAESRDLVGRTVAVTSGVFADAICDEATECGATATILEHDAPLAGFDCLVFVEDESWGIKELFELLKTTDLSTMESVCVFDDTGARIVAQSGPVDLSALQGSAGLIKSMAFEYPEMHWLACTGLTPFDEHTPAMIIQELADPGTHPEVAYENGTRFRFVPVAEPDLADQPTWAGLDESSVVVWLGGAQGISPHLISRMAAEMPCHFVLVGRTPRNAEQAAKYMGMHTREEVQKYLIQIEHMKDLKQVIAKAGVIMRIVGIEESLASISAAGATCSYEVTDARDPQAVRTLFADVRKKWGHIDGVVHAAGVIDDKLFRDKTWDAFENVYATKAAAVPAIAEVAESAKLVVFFSSTSAAFGNRGQTDYAAGNTVLDQAATVLSARLSDLRIVSFSWGGWKGAGMVSPTLEAEMGRRGLSLLPLGRGGDIFMDEIERGHVSRLTVMAGEEVQIDSFADLQSFVTTSRPSRG